MKNLIIVALGLATAVLLAACGKSSNETPIEAPMCGNQGYIFANGSCVSAASGIAPVNGMCPAGYGLINGWCYPYGGGIPGLGFYSDNFTGMAPLQKTGNMYNVFMKEAMGVCDRTSNVGGNMSCESFKNSARFDVVIQAPAANATSVQVTIRTGQPNNAFGGYGSWGYQLPSSWSEFLWGIPNRNTYLGAYLPTLSLYMSLSLQNKGFVLQGYGNLYSTANRGLIEIEVQNGKLDSPYGFDYKLRYKGEVIAYGRTARCASSDCKLSMPIDGLW